MADLFGFFRGKREPAKPTKLQGASGFAVIAGFIQSQEVNTKLQGQQRWKTAADILTNTSIVAASVRYMLNLIARPNWRFEAPDETDEAKKLAEWVEEVVNDIEGSWTSIVRRMALYRWHGYGMHEWQSKQRDDGKVGFQRIAVRPCHTVERWDMEPDGTINGVWQRRPIDGKEIYLPRAKTIYLVDDSLTDNPEGMGWFRHVAEPNNRLKNLLRIETMGFERDLGGIPVGKAPISKINSMVGQMMPNGEVYTKEMAQAEIQALADFVKLAAKKSDTGVLFDSQPHSVTGPEGEELSAVPEWGLDLLSNDANGLEAIAAASKRLQYEMALIIGTDSMLVGGEGEGSRALKGEADKNLFLQVESTLADMCEVVDRDLLTPLWAMNGLPDELKPKCHTESPSFKDVEKIARVLRDMATAGAVLAPDDPAIDDLRDALDIPRQAPLTPEERGILMGTKPSADAQLGAEQKEKEGVPPDDKNPPGGRGQAQKVDPTLKVLRLSGWDESKHPRDEIGRWTDVASAVSWQNPLVEAERIFQDAEGKKLGGVTVRDASGTWHLSDLRSITRGGGREAMQQVVDLADKHGKTISLFAVPLDSPAGLKMSKTKLRSWYSEFGFVREGKTDTMIRQPVRKFDPNQPRDPAGSPTGGQWTGGSGDFGVTIKPYKSLHPDHKEYTHQILLNGSSYTFARSSEEAETIAERMRDTFRRIAETEAEKRYNPNQPRDPAGTPTGGQWTDGDPDSGNVAELTKDAKRQFLIDPNRGKSLEQMHEEAIENQERLRGLASIIEEKTGTTFQEPPKGFEVKTIESTERKIRDEGYAGPHEITDHSRASFLVDSPEEGDKVVAALAEHGRVYDKGWKRIEEYGYKDRKVYIIHPNDGVSEIQITPRGVQAFKDGQGHQLYEIARKKSTPYVMARAAARKSRRMYMRILRRDGFDEVGEAA